MDNVEMVVNKETLPFFEYVFKGLMGLLSTGFIVFANSVWSDMKAQKGKTEQTEKDLSALKLHISEEYEKKGSVQISLSRIHERMDAIEDKIDNNYESISKDIKTLIGRK